MSQAWRLLCCFALAAASCTPIHWGDSRGCYPSNEFADGRGTDARFGEIESLAAGPGGELWVGDGGTSRIRRLDADGQVSTLVGGTFGFADGHGSDVRFSDITGLAVSAQGTIYALDYANQRVRRITQDGWVTTLAGWSDAYLNKYPPNTGDYKDGQGDAARFNAPRDVAVDASGSLVIADTFNHCIRKVTPEGLVTTLAGVVRPGFSGPIGSYQDGPASEARFNLPAAVAVAASGDVIIGDRENHRVRVIAPNGTVSTLAGSGVAGYKDGPALEAQFQMLGGLAADASGDIYVADGRIRRIRNGQVTTLAGTDTGGYPNLPEAFYHRVVVTPEGQIFAADGKRVFRIGADGTSTLVAGYVEKCESQPI